jgi:hypothetical protein
VLAILPTSAVVFILLFFVIMLVFALEVVLHAITAGTRPFPPLALLDFA